jgi:zinc transport system permease protein
MKIWPPAVGSGWRCSGRLLLGLVAGFTLLSVKAVGSLLVGALLVIPALTARLLAHSPTAMVLWAWGLGLLGLWGGLAGSVVWDLATGPAIVLVMVAGFLGVWGLKRL